MEILCMLCLALPMASWLKLVLHSDLWLYPWLPVAVAGAIATPLSAQAAADARDSMAKAVYARLFDWLVSVVNTAVDEAHNGASGGSGSVEGTTGRRHLSIGLLDIYGFESFQVRLLVYNPVLQRCGVSTPCGRDFALARTSYAHASEMSALTGKGCSLYCASCELAGISANELHGL